LFFEQKGFTEVVTSGNTSVDYFLGRIQMFEILNFN
jgi:hypothetical protein